jgi:tetratricopeptide (TPR) repeat protein
MLCILSQNVRAHDAVEDSLLRALQQAPNDTVQIRTLWAMADYYQNSKPDTSLFLARKALLISQKMGYENGVSWSLNQMAGALLSLGNYNKALEYYLDQLKLEEKANKPENLAIVNLNIANAYNKQEDFSRALLYAMNADKLIDENALLNLKAYSELNIGDMFEKMNLLDSALSHTISAAEMAISKSPELRGPALNNLANIYLKMDFPDVAYARYHEGLPLLFVVNQISFVCESYLGLARIHQLRGQYDSAFYYGSSSRRMASESGLQEKELLANDFLSNLFRATGKSDSAFIYLRSSIALKDSIFSKAKIRLSKEMAINEEIRQVELAEAKLKEQKERRASMQWLGIGIFIPLFILLTIYLSRKKVKVRIIKNAGIVSLLLLFEYITLLLHPRVVELTHHTPILEVLVFVVIASLLTPTHHRIEHILTKLLTKPYQHDEEPKPV